MELISKEDFRDRMYREAFEADSELQKWDSGCWVRYKLFEKILDEMPTVESRQKGKWMKRDSYDRRDNFYVCSECGRIINIICNAHLEDYPFCHCGADMRGEEE